jgi:AraC-like DNA-binding protein
MALDVRTLAVTFYGGRHIEPHAHPWGQLIYAAQGVMRVSSADLVWIVPPQRAVWAPPRVRHEIQAKGTLAMRTLYLAPRLARMMSAECQAIEVSPLLRELLLHIVELKMLDGTQPEHRRLIGVLTDQLRATRPASLSIRMPTDRRALAVAQRLERDPSDSAELEQLAQGTGASTRTLQRVFQAETGLRFAQWRQRLRLLHATTLLGTGSTVTQAAHESGYSSTSAFVAAFRKSFRETPMRYCR